VSAAAAAAAADIEGLSLVCVCVCVWQGRRGVKRGKGGGLPSETVHTVLTPCHTQPAERLLANSVQYCIIMHAACPCPLPLPSALSCPPAVVPPGYFLSAGDLAKCAPGGFREGWVLFSDPKATQCSVCGGSISSEAREVDVNPLAGNGSLVSATSASCCEYKASLLLRG
jgi:hypothetical protein